MFLVEDVCLLVEDVCLLVNVHLFLVNVYLFLVEDVCLLVEDVCPAPALTSGCDERKENDPDEGAPKENGAGAGAGAVVVEPKELPNEKGVKVEEEEGGCA